MALSVTLGRALEEERKAERMAAIGGALSSIVHDLRTPLTLLDGYARLLARLDAAMKNPPLCAADVSLSRVAAGEFDRLRRAVKRLPEQPSAGDLHAIRIKIRRARFAAELAQPVAGRPSERFIGKAKHLQDVLGEHQDAVTAQRYLRRTLGTGPAARRLAAQLIGRQQERCEAAREAFARQWPKLKRRGRRAWG